MERLALTRSKYVLLKRGITDEDASIYNVIGIIDINGHILYECVDRRDFDNFISEQRTDGATVNNDGETALQEACTTVLKTDPFGCGLAGKTLLEIYKSNFLWVDKAFKEMKNKYIVDKLKLIKMAVDDGKISI